MDRASELLEYYAEHPPGHIILAAVHLKPERRRRAIRESTASSQMHELSNLLGQAPSQKMPDHLRKMAEWAMSNLPRKRAS
jgi:hypothetical protein